MTNLAGKSVGDTVVEFFGPITDRNYHSAGPTELRVQVIGTGEIELFETQTFINASAVQGAPNPFSFERRLDDNTLVSLGTVNTTTGLVTITVTPDTTFSAIRAVVTAVGDGTAIIDTQWE